MNLLGVSGSLRNNSSNTRLLSAASECVSTGVQLDIANCLGDLPHFSPDLDPDENPITRAWVDQVRVSDGLVVSTPEYAGGYPGTLKNAFDWLVRTDAHLSKPFMMLHASTRSFTARDTLATVLETMDGRQITDANLTIHLVGNADEASVLAKQYRQELESSMAAFVRGIEALQS